MNDSRVATATLGGITGELAEIHAEVTDRPPNIDTLGLSDGPGTAHRAWAAVTASGLGWPARHVQIRLRPVWTAGTGGHFDLPVACAVLAATGQLPADVVAEAAVFGELAEDGTIRPVRGILPLVGAAARAGIRTVIVPAGNAAEAALAGEVGIVAVDSLHQLVGHLRGGPPPPPAPTPPRPHHSRPISTEDTTAPPAWWPLQVAAAGGHHLAIHGHHTAATPQVATLVGLLPDLDQHPAWEVTCLASLAGPPHTPTMLSRRPPHQILHPGATAAELEGHGRGLTRPGLLSMAHHGVLYLPDATRIVVEQLGQIRRAHDHHQVLPSGGRAPVALPARFQLALAAAPCPCPPGGRSCGCTPAERRRHLAPIRRLLDRAHIHLQPPPPEAAAPTPPPHRRGPAAGGAAAVTAARAAATARWAEAGQPATSNAQVPGRLLRQARQRLAPDAARPARRLLDAGELSPRGLAAVMRIAWTLADLDGRARPDQGDVTAACDLRRGGPTRASRTTGGRT